MFFSIANPAGLALDSNAGSPAGYRDIGVNFTTIETRRPASHGKSVLTRLTVQPLCPGDEITGHTQGVAYLGQRPRVVNGSASASGSVVTGIGEDLCHA